MAHGGLGLVYIRRSKFTEAIPELNQSVTIDPTPDPVNYLPARAWPTPKPRTLTMPSPLITNARPSLGAMQETCKKGAEEAKKLAGHPT